MRCTVLFTLILLLSACVSEPGDTVSGKDAEIRVAFYNVENLYDTVNDPATDDEEFLPEGAKKWNSERYSRKLSRIAEVVEALQYPELLGLAEVENRQVLEDLLQQEKLSAQQYQIVHDDSPDRRGIDVALLYRTGTFEPLRQKSIPVSLEKESHPTREILQVSGVLKATGDTLHLLLNHWPSRSGGKAESEPRRMAAAATARQAVDALLAASPRASVIVMGDFNDEPDDRSVEQVLEARSTGSSLDDNDLFNPMAALQQQGLGSYNFRGDWNMLDQIILSQGLLSRQNARPHYIEGSAAVFSAPWLLQGEGKYKGHPLRTYGGRQYLGGYSDHLPVFLELSTAR